MNIKKDDLVRIKTKESMLNTPTLICTNNSDNDDFNDWEVEFDGYSMFPSEDEFDFRFGDIYTVICKNRSENLNINIGCQLICEDVIEEKTNV